MPRSEGRRGAGGPGAALPWRPARVCLQGALVLELGALAVQTRGLPSAATWVGTWLLTLLVCWRRGPGRGLRREVRGMPAAWIAAMALVLTPLRWLWPEAGAPLDPLWMAWWVLPVSVLLDPATFRATRLPPLAVWAGLLASLVIALWGSEPWHSAGERSLLMIALATGFLIGVLAQTEAVERRAMMRGLPAPSSTGVSPTLRALALSTVLGAVVVTAMLESGLHRAEVWVAAALRPETEPFEELETERSVSRWPLVAHDETVLLHAHVLTPDRNDLGIRPLYLREQVLGQYTVIDGVPFLVAAQGSLGTVRDDEDGQRDDRIHWPGLDGWSGTPPRITPTQVLEIEAVEPPSRRRLAEPRLAWMEATELSVDLDGTVRSEPAADRYRFGSSPAEYFGWGIQNGRAAEDPLHTMLPARIRDAEWLEALAYRSVGGEDDDFRRARRLADLFFSTGTWQSTPDWNDDYREFLEGSRAGLCIQFAQSAALLARLIGLPARIAVGFASREFQEDGGFYVVRARNRHAWLEVNFEALGWVAFEVTPPRPAEEGFDPALWDEEGGIPPAAVEAPQVTRPRLSWLGLAVAFTGAAILVGSMLLRRAPTPGSGAMLETRRPPETGQAAWLLLRELEKACQRRGIRRAPAQTVQHFIAMLETRMPAAAGELRFLLGSYHECRFGARGLDPGAARRIREFLRRLPWQLRGAGEPVGEPG